MGKNTTKQIVDVFHELDRRAALALSEQRFEDALTIYGEVLKAERELKLVKESGHTLMNIANTLAMLGRYEEALAMLDEAAENREINKSARDKTAVQIFKANIHIRMGREQEAERILTAAFRSCRDYLQLGQMELLRYECYWKSNQRSKARSSLDRALINFELSGNREELKRALYTRIRYFESVGQGAFAAADKDRLRKLTEGT